MKKLIKLFCMITLFVATLSLVSCVLTENTTIEFETFPNSKYFLGEASKQNLLENVTIRVNGENPITLENAIKEYNIIVSGDDFNSIGKKKLVVIYNSLSITYDYEVIANVNQLIPDSDWIGNGTQKNPWEISSIEELYGLAEQVNLYGKHYTDEYFELVTDIDLNGKVWTPIGEGVRKYNGTEISNNNKPVDLKYFAGNFNGNDKTIFNLSDLGYIPSGSKTYQTSEGYIVENGYIFGLFGIVNDVSFENITMKDVAIYGASSIKSNSSSVFIEFNGDSVGAIAGYVMGNTSTTLLSYSSFNNCKVYGNINSYDAVGGIVGRDHTYYAKYSNCTNYSNISSTRKNGGKAGGIVGFSLGPGCKDQYEAFSICKNYGNITAINYAGGIAGLTYHTPSSNLKFTLCENTGIIIGDKNGQFTFSFQ